MSQTPSQPNEIGRAVVPFVGDTSNVKKAAAEAVAVTKHAVEEINREVDGAANKLKPSGGGGGGGGGVEPAGGGGPGAGFDKELRQSFTRIKAAASAAGAAIALADQALKAFASARSEVEALAQSFKDINDAGAGIRALAGSPDDITAAFRAADDQFNALVASVTSARNQELFSIQGLFDAGARKLMGAPDPFLAQIEQIENKRKGTIEAIEKFRDQRETESVERDLAALQQEATRQAESEYDAAQKINAELDKRLDKITDLREKAGKSGDLTDSLRKELDELERGFRDAARRGLEAGAKDAKDAIKRSIGDALTDIKEQASGMFSTDKLSIQLGDIKRVLDQIASNAKNIES